MRIGCWVTDVILPLEDTVTVGVCEALPKVPWLASQVLLTDLPSPVKLLAVIPDVVTLDTEQTWSNPGITGAAHPLGVRTCPGVPVDPFLSRMFPEKLLAAMVPENEFPPEQTFWRVRPVTWP